MDLVSYQLIRTTGLAMDCRVGLLTHSDKFLISHKKKSGVFFYLSEKSKNEVVRPKMMFLAILAKQN